MEVIGSLFSAVLSLFQLEVNLYGFTFSFWQVFVWTTVAGIVAWILAEVFTGE